MDAWNQRRINPGRGPGAEVVMEAHKMSLLVFKLLMNEVLQ